MLKNIKSIGKWTAGLPATLAVGAVKGALKKIPAAEIGLGRKMAELGLGEKIPLSDLARTPAVTGKLRVPYVGTDPKSMLGAGEKELTNYINRAKLTGKEFSAKDVASMPPDLQAKYKSMMSPDRRAFVEKLRRPGSARPRKRNNGGPLSNIAKAVPEPAVQVPGSPPTDLKGWKTKAKFEKADEIETAAEELIKANSYKELDLAKENYAKTLNKHGVGLTVGQTPQTPEWNFKRILDNIEKTDLYESALERQGILKAARGGKLPLYVAGPLKPKFPENQALLEKLLKGE